MVKRALLPVFLAVLSSPLILAESLPRGEKVSVPAGTTLHSRLAQTLNTKLNFQGDSFTATITEPLIMEGRDVIPVGSILEGRIARLERPGRVKGVGQMRLTAEKISFPDGRSFPLSAILVTAYGAEKARVVGTEGTVKGPSSRLQDVEEIGGGTVLGGIMGLLFHHPLLGATVGGTAGFVDRLRRRGKQLTIPSGTQLNYQLTRALEIYREYPQDAVSHRVTGSGH
jgi:hypothetical protein